MKSILTTVKYMPELINNLGISKTFFREASDNPEIRNYLSNNTNALIVAALNLSGSMIYDMCVENKNPVERKSVGRTTATTTLAINTIDDVIDQKPYSLDKKFEILDSFQSIMSGDQSISSQNIEEETAYVMARMTWADFLSKYDSTEYNKNASELVSFAKQQFGETDKNKLLTIEKNIGSKCLKIPAILTEMVTKKEFPKVKGALTKFGESSQLIDDIHDLDDDLLYNTNTYGTARVREEGNTSRVRNDIKNVLLSESNTCFKEGLEILDDQKHKNILNSLKNFFDFKYNIS